jgi:hypothetical protein
MIINMVRDVKGCSSCGHSYYDLAFERLEQPVDDYTHVAHCPNTDELVYCKVAKPMLECIPCHRRGVTTEATWYVWPDSWQTGYTYMCDKDMVRVLANGMTAEDLNWHSDIPPVPVYQVTHIAGQAPTYTLKK